MNHIQTLVLVKQAVQTPEEIFELIKDQLPTNAQLASGGLLDARGLSDVDVSVHDPMAKEKSKYSIDGYDRPVNVKISPDENILRAIKHRAIEFVASIVEDLKTNHLRIHTFLFIQENKIAKVVELSDYLEIDEEFQERLELEILDVFKDTNVYYPYDE